MSKASRWALVISGVTVIGASMVLFFLLSLATSSEGIYERHYGWLLAVNGVVAVLLVLVIISGSVRLIWRVRRGKFGSRLLLRLAAVLAMVSLMPGILIYTVSYQFVSRSIETWFDVKVAHALEAGLSLGRGSIDNQASELAAQLRLGVDRLVETAKDAPISALALERLREQLLAQDVSLLNAHGQVLVSAGGEIRAQRDRLSSALLRQARQSGVTTQIFGLDEDSAETEPRIQALAYLPSTDLRLKTVDQFLLVTQKLPTNIASPAKAVQSAYREYQQRALARDGFKRMYIGTLTLALILAVFGALLLAVTFSHQIAQPLLLLADGVRRVAAGDLTRTKVLAAKDELSGLTRSFADMTDQLSEARSLVQSSLTQLERARTNLQTILDNLTAGVIVLNRAGHIETVNPGATRILKLPISAYKGEALQDVPGLLGFANACKQHAELHHSSPEEAGERNHWQQSFELSMSAPPGIEADTLTLLVRGASMPQGARLLVFDDITEVVSAQRALAWSEVARRLAHEIKNPLTPIQLSAERLQHKLQDKVPVADQAMLIRSVQTIVNQVQAMKSLVNEFRDYAKLPSAQLQALDLNALVVEVLGLYLTAQETGHLRTELAPHLPAIWGDNTQLRQVIHNLVQNALDATHDQPQGLVQLRTHLVHNDQHEVCAVRLEVLDNGPGFADKVLKRAFEPYVTTKTKGTGLGLAVVKKIADEHGAHIRLSNRVAKDSPQIQGSQVSLSFSKFVAVGTATPNPT